MSSPLLPGLVAPVVRSRGLHRFPAPECPGYIRVEYWDGAGVLLHFGYTLADAAARPELVAGAQAWAEHADPTVLRLVG